MLHKTIVRILLLSLSLPLPVQPVWAKPTGSAVQSGDITITDDGADLTIHQSSDRGLIHWQDFSVNRDERVQFIQPSSQSVTANRVIGADASVIRGQIDANGQIILINANGIMFGEQSVIDSAGLIASTLEMNEADFLSGSGAIRFEAGAGGSGQIINNGTQLLQEGGLALLLAPQIQHNGLIRARLGRVSLAAADAVSVDIFGDGLLQFAPSGGVSIADQDTALIDQSGVIEADGGIVTLTSRAASDIISNSINLSGTIRARHAQSANGVITLSGDKAITIEESASLSADGITAQDDGGTITISADAIAQTGSLSADGASGGEITLKATDEITRGGTEQARGLTEDGGSITYRAETIISTNQSVADVSGAQNGGSLSVVAEARLNNAGLYDASGAAGQGGQIDMSADDVILSEATLDASGVAAGGLVRVGGAFQGGKTLDYSQSYIPHFITRWESLPPLISATSTSVSADSRIFVSSDTGDGGTAVIWSDGETNFLGSISATGAKGGAVELSSATSLYFDSLSDIQVGDGILLLDPKRVTIGNNRDTSPTTVDGDWGYFFADSSTSAINISASDIETQLYNGTDVVIQASDYIYQNTSLKVGSDVQNPGNLTYQAGRSIYIIDSLETSGGDITLIANDTVANGVVDAQRPNSDAVVSVSSELSAGTGDVNIILRAGDDKTYYGSKGIAVANIQANSISIVNNGLSADSGVTIASGAKLTAYGSGDAIIIAGDKFTNNSNSSALNPSHSSGRYLVWTGTPSADTLGGITPDFYQYNATYNTTTVAGGASENGLLYVYAPSLTPSFTGEITKEYDGTTSATMQQASKLSASGVQSGESVTLSVGDVNFTNGNVGSSKTIILSNISVGSASKGSADVYGYQMASTTATNNLGSITRKTLSLSGITVADKAYDGNSDATATSYGTLTGVVDGETVTVDTSRANVTFATKNAANGLTVNLTQIDLDGADAANYVLPDQTATADITPQVLNITAPSASDKTYDGDASATVAIGTLSGFVGSETVTATGSGSFSDANVGTGKSVTVAYTLADGTNGGLASNYSLGDGSTTADITAKALTITAPSAANKTYDASTSATVTAGTLSGFVGSETVTVTGSGTFSGPNVDTGKTVTVAYTLADGTNGGLASNYSLSDGSTTADITAKVLTITAPSASDKTYDASTSATVTAGTLSGFVGSETVTVTGTGTFADANVGSGKSVSVAYTLGNGNNGGRALNYSLADGSTTADITAKALTITAPSASDKTYDGDAVASLTLGTLSGFVGSETVTVTGAGSFSDANVGSGKSVTVAYTLADGTNGGVASNYSLSDGSTTADITAKALTITAPTAADKTYDGDTVAALTLGTLSGFVGSETVTVTGSGSFSDANVGSGKSVTVAYTLADGTNGGVASNYSLSDGSTTADITAKALTITAPSASDKTYDGDAVASLTLGTLSGFVGSETVTVTGSGTFSDANVGSGKSVTVAYTLADGTNGGVASNYSLSDGSTTADITAKALTITSPTAADKTYDASTSATITAGTLSGFVGSETVTVTGSGTFSDANVGSGKSVSVSYTLADGTNGGVASNYSLSDGSTTADITAKALTITAPSASDKTYDGDAVASLTLGTLSGFVGSETVTVTGSGTFADANVGTGKSVTVAYTLADGTNGGVASNYSLSDGSTTADITAKALTITAPTAADKTYDASTSATVTAGTLSGFVGSETVTVTGSGTFSDANVGTGKSVTVAYTLADGTNGGVASNYSLSDGSTTADITAKALTITSPTAADKTYDASTSATITAGTLSGFIGSETVTVTGSGTFSDANVGTGKSVSVSYTLADGTNGGVASNYSLSDGSTTADITAKALTITAPSAADKTYDASTSATVTAGTLSGFVGSETVTVTGSGTFSDANVGTGKSVSVSYTLADGTNGGVASNYSLSDGSTTADITAKALTITAPSAADKTYDASTSATVTAGTLSGFVGSETVTVTGSGTFSDANVGTGKSVSVSYTLADGTNGGVASNYSLSDGSTTADITAKALTITAPSASDKTYDASTSATITAGTLSGFVGSETVTVTGSGTFSDANVGSGKSVSVSYTLADGTNGGVASNYSLSDGSTTADITAKALTITSPTAADKTYDASTSATVTAGTLSGFVGSETVTVTGSGTFSDANVGTGKSVTVAYTLADGTNGGVASNYSLSDDSTTADITAKALTITAPSAADKTYDASTSATITAGTLSGFIGSETVTVTGSGTFSDANVGSGKSVSVSYTLADGTNGGVASNYSLSDGSTTADITAKALTITSPTASDKTYDGSASATVTTGTLSGLIGSDTVSVSSSAAFMDANVGTGKAVTITYNLSDSVGGAIAGNYSLANDTAIANINAKALSITTPTAANKTYDGSTSASVTTGTLSGFVGSETVTLFSNASFADANAGTGKAVTVSYALGNGNNGGLASNYSLANDTITADIYQKSLTITPASAQDRQYDATTNAGVTIGTLSGLIGSETVTATGAGTFSDANVGTGKSVSVSYTLADGSNGGLAANYALADTSTTASISARQLSVSGLQIADKIYDGTNSASITSTGQLTNFIAGEDIALNINTISAAFATGDAGNNKAVTISGLSLSGSDSANYILNQPAATATITPKALSITGSEALSKYFDGTRTAEIKTGTLAGMIGSETISVSASGLFDTAAAGTDKQVQVSYQLADGDFGGKAGNYSLLGEILFADITGKDDKDSAKIIAMAEEAIDEMATDILVVKTKLEETIIESLTETMMVENDYVSSMGEWHMLTCEKQANYGSVCSSR